MRGVRLSQPSLRPQAGDRENFILKQDVMNLVGRGTGQSLQLRSSIVSRQHGQIRYDSDSLWHYEDIGSSAGTTLNGQAVNAHVQVPLFNGDILGFGAAVESDGPDLPEFWVVLDVGRERPLPPTPLPPFPPDQQSYADSVDRVLKMGLRRAEEAISMRAWDDLWAASGTIINQLKKASSDYNVRTDKRKKSKFGRQSAKHSQTLRLDKHGHGSRKRRRFD